MAEIEFELDHVDAKMGKYSNNLEKHGDKSVPVWAVPFTEINLPAQKIRLLAADQHVDRSWFNTRKDTVVEPMPWLRTFRLECTETFEEAHFVVHFSDTLESEFENCKVKIIDVVPQTSGFTATAIQVQLKPNRKQLVLIHEHQGHTVKISLSNAKVAEKKKSGQTDFIDNPPAPVAETSAAAPPAMTGAHLAQGSGPGDLTPVHAQHGTTGEPWQGLRCMLPAGYVEIDPPKESESETKQSTAERIAAAAGDGGQGNPSPPAADDAADFEKGLAKAVGARVKRGSNVIDGTSERVRHRDRQAGKH